MVLEYSQNELRALEKESKLPPNLPKVSGSGDGAKTPFDALGVAGSGDGSAPTM